jgi:hypothetical protein
MRVALVNPRWTFDGSIYFGCREPHLPVEFGYARALLEAEGHQALLVDAQLHDLPLADVAARLDTFDPQMLVVTTAPSYLFWRCAPPELRVPHELLSASAHLECLRVVVGPHASTTPAAALKKLNVDVAVLGECEDVLPRLARTGRAAWAEIPSVAYMCDGAIRVQGTPHEADMSALPALRWPREDVISIVIITIASTRRREGLARRWRCHAAVPITAASARRTTSATTTGSGLCPSSSTSSMGCWHWASRTSISSTRSSCQIASCSTGWCHAA